ncbi:MAG: hypothetical protein E5V28_09560 [Mesorhizobium sp.]|nr:MAG: hypothetical protein E5V28_09560 [Mesorhizobium sp.]
MSCRTSPPQGGRSAASLTAPVHQRWRSAKAAMTAISPLVGEMSGRTEGSAVPLEKILHRSSACQGTD